MRSLRTVLGPVVRRIQYAGPPRRYCPVCDRRFRRFADTGTPPRRDVRCPMCGSLERHRTIALYLRDRSPIGERPTRVLHVAPEPGLRRVIRRAGEVDYRSVDLASDEADVHADISQRTPFADDDFDVILCSHVLEHIEDDLGAIRELGRLLKPDGVAYIVVPYRVDAPTHEDPTITTATDRERAFGQSDHVRIYGRDVIDRLSTVFHVETVRYADELPPEEVERMRLRDSDALNGSTIHVCTQRGTTTSATPTRLDAEGP